EVRRRLDGVEHVVERRGERVDVFAIHRRDERRVQALDDLVGDRVALVLSLLDPSRLQLDVGEVLDEVLQQRHGGAEVLGAGGEEFEEDFSTLRDLEFHRMSPRSRIRRFLRFVTMSSAASKTNQNSASAAIATFTQRYFCGV